MAQPMPVHNVTEFFRELWPLILWRHLDAGLMPRPEGRQIQFCLREQISRRSKGFAPEAASNGVKQIADFYNLDDQILALVERCEIENDEARVLLVRLDSRPKGMECIRDEFEEELDSSEPISIPIQIKKQRGEVRIRHPSKKGVKPKPEPSLIKAVVKGHAWREQLEEGSFSSVRELARDAGFTHRCVGRLLRLAWLAPDIIEAILDGTQPEELSLENFRQPISADWNKQRKLFGIV
jgi:hypothetical protein